MPLIIPANTLSGGYEIDNSVRFNQSDHCLTKTFGSAGDRKKWTFSVWFKRSNLITSAALFVAGSSGQAEGTIRLENHKINWQEYDGSSMDGELLTNQVLRDVTAWYHMVCVWDSANATAGNRMRIYLNGSEITSFATDNNPTLNFDSQMNNNVLHNVGRQSWNNASDFDGYMADVNFIDGEAYDSSYFGETNDNGVWIPKKYDGSYGDNGFFLECQQTGTGTDASGIGADTSGETNHWAINNLAATDITTDTPTNNFATLNSITSATNDLSEGNTVSDLDNGTTNTSTTQFSANGKWYAEFKVTDLAGSNSNIRIGVVSAEQNAVDLGGPNETYAFLGDGRKYVEGSASSYGSALNVNDIVMVALDTDNNKVWYGANGTWFASGDPSSNSNESHAIDSGPSFGFAIASGTSSASPEIQCNFGNPPFSISSGNSDDNGFGNFEYDVPTGFYSLCTKNLAEYG